MNNLVSNRYALLTTLSFLDPQETRNLYLVSKNVGKRVNNVLNDEKVEIIEALFNDFKDSIRSVRNALEKNTSDQGMLERNAQILLNDQILLLDDILSRIELLLRGLESIDCDKNFFNDINRGCCDLKMNFSLVMKGLFMKGKSLIPLKEIFGSLRISTKSILRESSDFIEINRLFEIHFLGIIEIYKRNPHFYISLENRRKFSEIFKNKMYFETEVMRSLFFCSGFKILEDSHSSLKDYALKRYFLDCLRKNNIEDLVKLIPHIPSHSVWNLFSQARKYSETIFEQLDIQKVLSESSFLEEGRFLSSSEAKDLKHTGYLFKLEFIDEYIRRGDFENAEKLVSQMKIIYYRNCGWKKIVLGYLNVKENIKALERLALITFSEVFKETLQEFDQLLIGDCDIQKIAEIFFKDEIYIDFQLEIFNRIFKELRYQGNLQKIGQLIELLSSKNVDTAIFIQKIIRETMNQERFEEVEQLLEWIPEKEKESVRKVLHSSEAFQQFDQKRKSQFIRNSLRFFGFPSKQSESFSMEF